MNNNSLMFRFDEELLKKMRTIKKHYPFRSNSEFAKYCTIFLCTLIYDRITTPDKNETTIEDIFDEYMEDESFDYIKPKRKLNKAQILTLDEYCEKEEGGVL